MTLINNDFSPYVYTLLTHSCISHFLFDICLYVVCACACLRLRLLNGRGVVDEWKTLAMVSLVQRSREWLNCHSGITGNRMKRWRTSEQARREEKGKKYRVGILNKHLSCMVVWGRPEATYYITSKMNCWLVSFWHEIFACKLIILMVLFSQLEWVWGDTHTRSTELYFIQSDGIYVFHSTNAIHHTHSHSCNHMRIQLKQFSNLCTKDSIGLKSKWEIWRGGSYTSEQTERERERERDISPLPGTKQCHLVWSSIYTHTHTQACICHAPARITLLQFVWLKPISSHRNIVYTIT